MKNERPRYTGGNRQPKSYPSKVLRSPPPPPERVDEREFSDIINELPALGSYNVRREIYE